MWCHNFLSGPYGMYAQMGALKSMEFLQACSELLGVCFARLHADAARHTGPADVRMSHMQAFSIDLIRCHLLVLDTVLQRDNGRQKVPKRAVKRRAVGQSGSGAYSKVLGTGLGLARATRRPRVALLLQMKGFETVIHQTLLP